MALSCAPSGRLLQAPGSFFADFITPSRRRHQLLDGETVTTVRLNNVKALDHCCISLSVLVRIGALTETI
ncbi:MAG: hypothetical protein FRX48_04197 [Lasallia pustulata]|uniref:Uncharacterized protein n=1 Tax=Lasallia pustulata TaxID=136370 RepID=A0A5M8PRJ3_9LECA|nr:MAG: hypothetical protein FRX48_04197 [Lasallia pustulata]